MKESEQSWQSLGSSEFLICLSYIPQVLIIKGYKQRVGCFGRNFEDVKRFSLLVTLVF